MLPQSRRRICASPALMETAEGPTAEDQRAYCKSQNDRHVVEQRSLRDSFTKHNLGTSADAIKAEKEE